MATRRYNIRVEIIPPVIIEPKQYTLSVEVLPGGIGSKTLNVPYNFNFNLVPIEVNVTEPIRQVAFNFLNDIITDFIDENRELKTLLNFGEDTQDVVLNYRYGIPDSQNNNTLQVKLLKELPDNVGLNTPTFLSRELANTVIDKVRVRFAPELDTTPYLRPRNEKIDVNTKLGKTLNNVTLRVLSLETGSYGSYDSSNNVSFEDSIFRQWYSFDFDSAELNIDFVDYSNFVFYGSAAMRLAAFREKLKQIESLESNILQFSGSLFTGSLEAFGAATIQERSALFAREKEDIIRSFDRYEQYLFFTPSGSDSPYSGSLWYDEDWYDYNPIGYWPKDVSGSLYPVDSTIAQDWYVTQSAIAQRYDEGNENNLINTVPTHIREHEDNAAYFTFVAMIGHFFDTVKPYVDQFTNIQSRYTDPDKELSKDLVVAVAESVGFELPTINSIYSLSETVLGTNESEPRRKYTAQTHKRLLHNLPYFAKTKGTRESLISALKTLGLTEQLITIRELGSANTGSLTVFDEYTNGLQFSSDTPQFIILPLSASNRTPFPRSLQFGVKIPTSSRTTILNGNDEWALDIVPHPTNTSLGRFEILSGSSGTTILSSSYEKVFDNELINVAIRTYTDTLSANLFVGQTYREDIIFTSSMSEQSASNVFIDLWNNTENLYVGGSGSLVTASFDGTLDEVRLWGINLTDENTVNAMFDPATNAGNTYDDASEYLYVQLSFDKIDETLLPTFLDNESPYRLQDGSPSLEIIATSGITTGSLTRYNRTIRQLVPNIGGSTFVTKKINIAPEPVFEESAITRTGVKKLSRTKSIVKITDKEKKVGRNTILVGTSPTQLINQRIIRNIGLQNINETFGIPNDLYKGLETTLDKLRQHYVQYYYVDVNYNRYIRILSEVNSVIGQMVDYFIPSRANTLKGIIIEPNILERNKLKKFGNIRVYGAKARRTLNAPGSLTGSKPDYDGTFNLTKTIDTRETTLVTSSYKTHKGRVESTLPTLSSLTSSLKGKVEELPRELNSLVRSYSSQSKATKQPEYETLGTYGVYDVQHETLKDYLQIQSGSKKARKSFIDVDSKTPSGEFSLIDRQHVDWYKYLQISQSIKKSRPSAIQVDDNILSSTYELIDRQHLPWNEYLAISQSSGRVYPKQVIDLQLDTLNKVGFNTRNLGSPGAEPFYRLYPRKLFKSEISASRTDGFTSIYKPALYDIKPRADLTDDGVRTFFNKTTGIYYFKTTQFTPVTRNRLPNQAWNGETFVGATTWSYGQSYNENDVVYQNVTTNDTQLGNLIPSARKGNDNFYIFKSKNYIRVPDSGEAVYSGSIPTTVPPSIDRTQWSRIKFKPIEVRQPRRIVFDTFTVPDPSLNNFKTTTVSIDRIIDIQTRYLDTYRIGNIEPNGIATGELSVQNIALLFAIQSNNENIRIRLYRTEDDRDADINRSSITKPNPEDGVLIDKTIGVKNIVQTVNPITALIAGSIPPGGKLFYTINNLDNAFKLNTTILAYYYAIEVEPRIPQGYLRKHYRFYRDNFLATRRRNFLGCKNTVNTTIDGLPPVQIFIGEGTELNVSPTTEGNEVITGGGGTLNST